MDDVKEWKLILDYDFDESESVPNPIDVSKYTEFMCVGIGLVNKHESAASSCNVYVNNKISMRLDTQANKNTSSTRTQYIFGEYNGLVFRQYKMPFCANNYGTYDAQLTNLQSPYTYTVMNTPPSSLSILYNSPIYACISGNIKIYAR